MSFIPSEKEIMDRVEADWDKPMVTFLCFTYNQQDYIEQAIKGFLIQKTSFPYEILIHDDCSTDNTQKIIEDYRSKYPRLIRSIIQTENQYSKGVQLVIVIGKQAKSNYIALCEGDDYWFDENKIEEQFKLILNDPTISMVLSPGRLEVNGKVLDKLDGFHGDTTKSINAQEIVDDVGQFAPTASYLVRKEYLIKPNELFMKAPAIDTFVELYSALFGKLIYYPKAGSVYRVMAKNSWSEKMVNNKLENYLKFVESMKQTIEESKNIEKFEDLDWSLRFAALHYNLSKIYLEEKGFSNFREHIEISKSHGDLKKLQKIFFYFRKHPYLLYLNLNSMLKIKNIIDGSAKKLFT